MIEDPTTGFVVYLVLVVFSLVALGFLFGYEAGVHVQQRRQADRETLPRLGISRL